MGGCRAYKSIDAVIAAKSTYGAVLTLRSVLQLCAASFLVRHYQQRPALSRPGVSG